jgi:hypothetical protein
MPSTRMPFVVGAVGAVGAVTTALLAPVQSAATVPGGIAATVVDYAPPVSQATYPGVDHGTSTSPRDDRFADTTWRVVETTGNCCENYVTATPQGRLLDFGGTYVNFSDDRGLTWKQVQPQTPLVNGEGSIVNAPDGDVLGVGWDPYSGDHLQSYKYEADTGEWRYDELPLHQPFYDREWLAVVPGPVTIDGTTYPWVSLLKGGFPTKEAWYYSTDGLDYTNVTSKFVEQMFSGAATSSYLDTTAQDTHDWTQPNTNGGMTALGGGDALAAPDQGDQWYHLDGQTFTWSAFTYPDGTTPEGIVQVDSQGRLHEVVRKPGDAAFVYRMSADGGRTWRATTVNLPADHVIEEIDFRASSTAGVAAVGIHGHDNADDADQDLAYKLDISRQRPRLLRSYEVGLGDVNGASGIGEDVRFDFETIAVFPDGRLALSFYDSTTTTDGDVQPALAIEQDTTLGGRVPPPDPGDDEPPVLGTPYASYGFDDGAQGWTTGGVPTWTRSSPGQSDGQDDASSSAFGVDQVSYTDNMDATLTSPPIAAPAGPTVLQFWVRHDTEQGFDFVDAQWSGDGTTWRTLSSYSGQNQGYPGWSEHTVGFDSPGGQVQVRFRFASDLLVSGLSGGYQGARVDDVVVGSAG